MRFIIDRKKKRSRFDNQWNDPFGLEELKNKQSKEVLVSSSSENAIDKALLMFPFPKALFGKKVWCVKSDGSKFISGHIVNVYPSRHLLIKQSNGENIPVEFESVLSLEA